MRRLLTALALLLTLAAQAQERPRITMKQAELIIPRPAKHPVKSLIPGETAPAVDTLDTSDPRVKLVLRSDHSWAYVRDRAAMESDPVYAENWDTHAINPYGEQLQQLPSRVTLWLVDSVSSWKCPFVAPVYSKFGRRGSRYHMGVDLPAARGREIYAAFEGKVRISQYSKSFGNVVIIRHPCGLETTYAHLSERRVSTGEWVSAGQVVGLAGSTGRSTGSHLHFETRWHGYAFDPQWIADFGKGELRSGVFVLKTKHLLPGSNYVSQSLEEEEEIYLTEEQERAEAERIAAELAAMKYHKIVSGDTLTALALKYHTSVSEICRLNGITRES